MVEGLPALLLPPETQGFKAMDLALLELCAANGWQVRLATGLVPYA
jgi:hypothetical protein